MKDSNLMQQQDPLSRIHDAEVVANMDPTFQGRIKVSIPEIFGNIPAEGLPWIYPFGYNCGLTLFHVPSISTAEKPSRVKVLFLNKDIYSGFYAFGSYPMNVERVFNEGYPNIYGFQDDKGNYCTIDKSSGKIKLHHAMNSDIILDADGSLSITHMSGATLVLDPSGALSISTPGDTTLTAPTTKIVGNATISGTLDVAGASTLVGTCTFEGKAFMPHAHTSSAPGAPTSGVI